VFGLQLPKSKAAPQAGAAAGTAKKKPKAFSMDDEDEDDEAAAAARARVGPTQLASIRAQKYAREAARVLEQDPSAFAYDELFDEKEDSNASLRRREALPQPTRLGMVASSSGGARVASVAAAAAPAAAAPSRYIESLLAKAAVRKLEAEAVYERQQLRARAADDEEHADKEKFVTAAFREKMAAADAARAKLEEQDRSDEAAERLRAKGGAAGASLAMQASRAILNSRAGVAPMSVEEDAIANATTAASAAGAAPRAAAPAASSASSDPSPSSAGVGSKHPRDTHDDGKQRDSRPPSPDAKRARTTAAAESDASPRDSAVAAAIPDAAAITAPPSTAATALPDVRTAALAAVEAKLTSAAARSSKAEEARARLLARKQAAGAAP
jgi:coiled-coil domain-containing protein 55